MTPFMQGIECYLFKEETRGDIEARSIAVAEDYKSQVFGEHTDFSEAIRKLVPEEDNAWDDSLNGGTIETISGNSHGLEDMKWASSSFVKPAMDISLVSPHSSTA